MMKKLLIFLFLFFITLKSISSDSLYYSLPFDTLEHNTDSATNVICFNRTGYLNKKAKKEKYYFISLNIDNPLMDNKEILRLLLLKDNGLKIIIMIINTNNNIIYFDFKKTIVLFNR